MIIRWHKEYKWVLDRLKKELPRWEIRTSEFDWGRSFVFAARLKGRRVNRRVKGYILEMSGMQPGTQKYSLNKDRKRRSIVNRMIRELKELEET